MTRLIRYWAIALLLGGSLVQLHASPPEEVVKCAFLYNFAKFVKWPDQAFESPTSPINVGFVGGASFSNTFREAVKGRNTAGRDFVVKTLVGVSGIQDCQIVFIGDETQMGLVIQELSGKPVLIVGEAEGLLDAGGAIRLFKENGKIAFDINIAAAKAADLQLDSRLLSLAKRPRKVGLEKGQSS